MFPTSLEPKIKAGAYIADDRHLFLVVAFHPVIPAWLAVEDARTLKCKHLEMPDVRTCRLIQTAPQGINAI